MMRKKKMIVMVRTSPLLMGMVVLMKMMAWRVQVQVRTSPQSPRMV